MKQIQNIHQISNVATKSPQVVPSLLCNDFILGFTYRNELKINPSRDMM